MSLTVEGVPEAITRKALKEWCAVIGLDVDHLVALRVDRGGIYAEVLAKKPDGKHFVIGGQAARHEVAIPIVDGLE